jgi:hypothetical protein
VKRALLVAVVALVGCRDKSAKDKQVDTAKRDTTKPDASYVVDSTCKSVIDKLATTPINARPKLLLDNCRVCGDFDILLGWNHDGTKPEDLQKTLEGCGAFCTGDAKMKFIAAANKAKGTSNDMAWRKLADACGDKVDASSDHRFMSAPYFALDRIARAIEARHVDGANALGIALPPLTVAGTGIVLPDLDEGVSPKVGTYHLSFIGDQIFIGKLPHAKLGAKGLEVTNDYPGQQVALANLPAALKKLIDNDPTETLTLLAPHAMPAENLVPVIQAAGAIAPLYLAATAHESPEGWQLPGAIPVAIGPDGDGAIGVTGEMTVQNLATELGQKAAQSVKRVGVTKR